MKINKKNTIHGNNNLVIGNGNVVIGSRNVVVGIDNWFSETNQLSIFNWFWVLQIYRAGHRKIIEKSNIIMEDSTENIQM